METCETSQAPIRPRLFPRSAVAPLLPHPPSPSSCSLRVQGTPRWCPDLTSAGTSAAFSELGSWGMRTQGIGVRIPQLQESCWGGGVPASQAPVFVHLQVDPQLTRAAGSHEGDVRVRSVPKICHFRPQGWTSEKGSHPSNRGQTVPTPNPPPPSPTTLPLSLPCMYTVYTRMPWRRRSDLIRA